MTQGATTRATPAAAPRAPLAVRAALWPAAAGTLLAGAAALVDADVPAEIAQAVVLVAAVAMCGVAERAFPASERWRPAPEARSRDLVFGGIGLAIETAAAAAVGAVVLGAGAAGDEGAPLARAHPAVAVLALLVAYELVQYGLHRGCHELRGTAGRFLWRLHSVHHRPEALNARMSLVAHPLETAVTRAAAVCAPVLLLGAGAEAAYWLVVVVNVQTVLVHWNADVSLGPLRHVFVGPALHRIHHGAGRDDGRNYAALFTVADLAFGTFHEKGGAPPDRIGIRNDRRYPGPLDVAGLLRWPFVRRRRAVSRPPTAHPRT